MGVVAVVDPQSTTRYDLKSLPGGWVEIRKMTYGQKLQRQEIAFSMTTETGKKKGRKDLEISSMQKAVSEFEFRCCIADHNLEDASGEKLDLGNPFQIRHLLPSVGTEIEDFIAEENEFDEESLTEE